MSKSFYYALELFYQMIIIYLRNKLFKRTAMKEKEKTTFRKIEYHKKESFYLIVRGLEVGVTAGLISVLYRFLLSFAEDKLHTVLDFVKGNPFRIAAWLVALMLIGAVVYFITRWEPMSAGSGIPQINGEVKGYFSQS